MLNEIIFLKDASDDEKQLVESFVLEWNNKFNYVEISTSGSTGQPKKNKILKSVMKASAKATGRFFDFKSTHTILLSLSPKYIAGMMQIVRAIIYDMTIVVSPFKKNPITLLGEFKIDFAAFVPYQIQAILEDEKTKFFYENIGHVIIGGAPISNKLFSNITKLPNNNYAAFGMTETISHVALKRIRKNQNYYAGMNDVSFSVDTRSCLIIDAPYLNINKLITNDIVELISNTCFNWVGRFDFVINSGGIKIHPEQIEKKIANILEGYEFYITKKNHELLGDQVVLIIQSDNDLLNSKELKKQFHTVLKPYEIPKIIEFEETFKKTKTGKIIRQGF